eukprot:486740-Pyramimonas_sp.AAC.1
MASSKVHAPGHLFLWGTPIYRVEDKSRNWGSHTSREKIYKEAPRGRGRRVRLSTLRKRRQRV